MAVSSKGKRAEIRRKDEERKAQLKKQRDGVANAKTDKKNKKIKK